MLEELKQKRKELIKEYFKEKENTSTLTYRDRIFKKNNNAYAIDTLRKYIETLDFEIKCLENE